VLAAEVPDCVIEEAGPLEIAGETGVQKKPELGVRYRICLDANARLDGDDDADECKPDNAKRWPR